MVNIKRKNKKPGFIRAKGKTAQRKQKAAIKSYYAEKETESTLSNLVSVLLKKHGDKNGGHHHVILEDIEDKHVSVGLTTQKTKGKKSKSKNYNCKCDVIGNGENSYMRRQGTVDFQKNYYEPTTGKMTEEAYAQAKVYGERAKQKFLEKKEKVTTVPSLQKEASARISKK